MSRTNFAPIFILGVPRSGTTLLRILLDTHSEIAGAPETSWLAGGYGKFSLREFLDYLCEDQLGPAQNLSGVTPAVVKLAGKEFITSILRQYLLARKRRYLVLKTPDDIRYLRFILEFFPNSKYIHICRDGRDVACSTVAQKETFFGADVLKEYGELTVMNALRRWCDWEKKVRDCLKTGAKKHITISYEDLVTEPVTILKRVTKFIGVKFESRMVRYEKVAHEYPNWEAGSSDVKSKTGINRESVGRWKRDIPFKGWGEIDELSAEMLSALGYPTCAQVKKESALYIYEELERLQEETKVKDAELREKTKNDMETGKRLGEMQQRLSEQDGHIKALEGERQTMTAELEESQRRLMEMQENLSASSRYVETLIEQGETKITELNQTSKRISELENDQADKAKKVGEQDKIIQRLRIELEQKKKSLENLQNMVRGREESLRLLKEQLVDKEHAIQGLLNSKTFKVGKAITYPVRVVRGSRPKKNGEGSTIQASRNSYQRGYVNLGKQLTVSFGNHRSGWSYAVAQLVPLHNDKGIYLDTFIERTFVWSAEGAKPTLEPWIGFIHVPPNVPEWFQYEQSNDILFLTKVWNESLGYCRGLYTLSEYHKKALEPKLGLPINALLHPTEEPAERWSFEKFETNAERKIIQVGWWLRKLHAIFELPESNYTKVMLRVTKEKYLEKLFKKERKIRKSQGLFRESMYDTARVIDYLRDDEYDHLLAENLVFIDLYDASANNTVIECIVRGTPILVNPLEPVVEYLGEAYPFYFSSYEEAIAKARDIDLVYDAHTYLRSHPIREKLKGQHFIKSFVESSIFRNL
jgi:hypothetical protein